MSLRSILPVSIIWTSVQAPNTGTVQSVHGVSK